jgi:uncharacterized membrane-anchored protein YjiN (DUF445 family)
MITKDDIKKAIEENKRIIARQEAEEEEKVEEFKRRLVRQEEVRKGIDDIFKKIPPKDYQ